VTPSEESKQILVVDDDPAVLRVVQRWLMAAGYDVTACERFESAKEYLAGHTPDILLTDVRLGAFNGLQLVIHAKERGSNMTVVVMSAFDDPALRREADHCGAAYLTKPFTHEEMLAALTADTPRV
jgi:two-component system phosphate regulon response regulator OmpR